MELTTIEILELIKSEINKQDLRRLKFILSFSDQVKFATYLPTEEENKEYLEKAIETITKIHQHNSSIKKEDIIS